MSALRPLPSRPSLEFEYKEAKALLRRLRADDPESRARARARHPSIGTPPERIRLADAQLVIAREYGFASWPRLVHGFGDVERQRHGLGQLHGERAAYEGKIKDLLSEHYAPRDWARRFLDRHHKPAPAARQMVPDFIAAGVQGFMPPMPYADDEAVLLEVLLVAMLNGRTTVIEALAKGGAPVNSLLSGNPLIQMAVGNAMTEVTECLVRCVPSRVRGNPCSQGANGFPPSRE